MTVKELIEQLQTLDPDLHVFVRGYEGGYEDVVSVGNIQDVALNYHDEWYYGPYTDVNLVDNKDSYTIVKGVIL